MNYDISHVKVHGTPLTDTLKEPPRDLFIPPHALEIYLDIFEGPLDVLLYLIRKQKLDMNDLPILLIIDQYLEYVEILNTMHIDLAADYLVMAATLTHMKSCALFPKPMIQPDDEHDPRQQLIEQLKAYQAIKHASEYLDQLPRIERDCFVANVDIQGDLSPKPSEISLQAMISSLKAFITKQQVHAVHHIESETISLDVCMNNIIHILRSYKKRNFLQLIDAKQGISGMITHFLAILQLNTSGRITLLTHENTSDICVSLIV